MPPRTLEDYRRRLRDLARELEDVDFVLRGSIGVRYLRCNTPNCRCTTGPEHRHGPYYHWTRKVRGKTVCVSLSPEDAAKLGVWIENTRRIERVWSKMEALTLQAVGLIRG